jgi:hypothetical protein
MLGQLGDRKLAQRVALMAMQDQATPTQGQRWIQKGDEMVLFDTRRGVEIFRKPIGEATLAEPSGPKVGIMPTTTVTADRDPSPPAPDRPTVPIQSSPPKGVTHQPQGDDLKFGEAAPPPPVSGGRFAGQPPPSVDRQPRRVVVEPAVGDIAEPSPVDLPALPETKTEEPMIKLPQEEKPRKATPLETPTELRPVKMPRLTEAADSLRAMLDSTAEATGGTQDPTGGVIVTEESLLSESTPTDDVLTSDRQLVIDPSINEAWIVEDGAELYRFHIGTGDTTGTRFGSKYFTPNGVFQVMNEVPYGAVEGSFGPLWMGLARQSGEKLTGPGGGGIGLHGQHAAADLNPLGEGFVNEGFVSHGCIRFRGNDILKVGELLDRGATVRILPYRVQQQDAPLALQANELGL